MNSGADIERLLSIMERLRDPGSGCPWDTKQTFRTIAPYTLEEAFEVVDAIEHGDLDELCEELGDLLFQVVFHARMAEERGVFGFPDVVHGICDKMIRRHPHVFGDIEHVDDVALREAWEHQKHRERAGKRGGGGGHVSLMEGVAKALPALVRAEKLQRRAARGAFDWDRPDPVLDKIREELEECAQAMAGSQGQAALPVLDKIREELEECAQAMAGSQGQAALQEEVGDLLFSCVNLARHLGVEAEQALRGANVKFERRFRFVEQGLERDGLAPGDDTRERMEALWETAKQTLDIGHGKT